MTHEVSATERTALLKRGREGEVEELPATAFVIYCSVLVAATASLGFTAFDKLLVDNNIGSWLCSGEGVPCDRQNFWLTACYLGAIRGVNLLAGFVGITVDCWGRQKAIRLYVLLWIMSMCLFGAIHWCPKYVDILVLFLSQFGLLIAGCGIFLGALTLAENGTRDDLMSPSDVATILTVAWDLSTAFYWVFNILYYEAKFPLYLIAMGYAGVIGLPLLHFSWFLMTPLHVERQWVTRHIKSGGFWVASLFLCIFVVQQYFWHESLEKQTNWIDGNSQETTDRHLLIFSILRYALPLVTIFLGWLSKSIQTVGSIVLLGFIAAIIGILSCIQVPWIQFIVFVLYIPWRIFTYVVVITFTIDTWGVAVFGRLYGTMISLTGVSIFSSYGIDYFVKTTFQHEYFWPNAFLTILELVVSILFAVCASCMVRRIEYDHERLVYVEESPPPTVPS